LSLVGIVANPASGKDIRRVVSQATSVNNHEKVSIVQRLLLGLQAGGVQRVEIMPDYFGIGERALTGLRNHPGVLAATSLIDMPIEHSAEDSLRAAQYLRDAGAGCIVVLGGDGTCRVVAKGCGEVPLLPISTGTNNVLPSFVEGTIAGSAAAYIVGHPEVDRARLCRRHKRLLIAVNGQLRDQALVEVTLVSTAFVGARAVWETQTLRQIFVSRAQPVNIGLSAIIGVVHPVGPAEPVGATARIAPNGQKARVPLAPGHIVSIGIGEIAEMQPGVAHGVLDERPAVLALDGEREIPLRAEDRAEVTLDLDGPWLVDIERTQLVAVADGEFVI
jgi:predicted polyphosphate/ATP-dependent NAD kinase